MNKILTGVVLILLTSCQNAEETGNDSSNTTTLSARVERAAGVSLALYDSAITVKVSLTAGSYFQTQTHPFSDGGCDFTGVPIGVPYTLSFQGLDRSGIAIWSGTGTGTTASSTTEGGVAATTATVVVAPAVARDSTLSALSTSPGTFTSTFIRSTTTYVDSLAAGVTSVAVTAVPNTLGDVSNITYGDQTSNVVTLGLPDSANAFWIPVTVTNRNGNSLIYKIQVFHKKAAVTTARDSTLSALSTNPGVFTTTFVRTTASYVDSVAAGTNSVTVTATANTPSDVSGITYNGQTSNVLTLNTTDPTSISVMVTDQNGNKLTYTIQVFHKKSAGTTTANTDSTFGIPWNSAISYGTLTDSRNGQSYRTVTIGSQIWMAQNLNYAGTGSTVGVCYNNSPDSCSKYGRLYTWAEATAGSASSGASPSGVEGVCPSGWHLPSNGEWTTLQTFVYPSSKGAAPKLMSTSGWINTGLAILNGTDNFGFRALPAGDYGASGFSLSGWTCNWWTATSNAGYGWDWGIDYSTASLSSNLDALSNGFSVRCMAN